MFKKRKFSTRRLLNLNTIEDNHLLGYNHHTIFYYQIAPYNLSVLSEENIHAKIFGMMNIIKNYGELEILVLNNRENYGLNKEFLKHRMSVEETVPIKKLLQKDLEYIDKIQVQTATARSFLIALRFRGEIDRSIQNILSSIEKSFMQHGFVIN